MNKGFSYVELIFALAILSIGLTVVFPALSMAAKNNAFALSRRHAQTQAHTLTLEMETAWLTASATEMQSRLNALVVQWKEEPARFIYRVGIYAGEWSEPVFFVAGLENWNGAEAYEWPEPETAALVTEYPVVAGGFGCLITVELWDENGNLAAKAVRLRV